MALKPETLESETDVEKKVSTKEEKKPAAKKKPSAKTASRKVAHNEHKKPHSEKPTGDIVTCESCKWTGDRAELTWNKTLKRGIYCPNCNRNFPSDPNDPVKIAKAKVEAEEK